MPIHLRFFQASHGIRYTNTENTEHFGSDSSFYARTKVLTKFSCDLDLWPENV